MEFRMKTLRMLSLSLFLLVSGCVSAGDDFWDDFYKDPKVAACGAGLVGAGTPLTYKGMKQLNYMRWLQNNSSTFYPADFRDFARPFFRSITAIGAGSTLFGAKLICKYYKSNTQNPYYPTKR
jgi:hypothetical protein